MKKRALITAEVHPETISNLESLGYQVELRGWGQTHQALTEEQLIEAVDGIQLLVVELEQVTAKVISKASDLELIQVCRAAPTIVDLPAATAAGIPVLIAPGRNAQSVAEYAFGALLTLARRLHLAHNHLCNRGWMVDDQIPYFHFRGPELSRKTFGFIGCGAIGQQLARLIRGFDPNLLIYDPYLKNQSVPLGATSASLNLVLQESDVVFLLCAVTEETRNMIGTNELGLMKPTAFLVNSARAAIVEEQALLSALEDGMIAGAVLDVFWEEPLPDKNPWKDLDQVLITPHIAGAAEDVSWHQGRMLLEDLKKLQKGEMPERLSNPEALVAS